MTSSNLLLFKAMLIAGFPPIQTYLVQYIIYRGKLNQTKQSGDGPKISPVLKKRWLELTISGYGNIGAGVTNPSLNISNSCTRPSYSYT